MKICNLTLPLLLCNVSHPRTFSFHAHFTFYPYKSRGPFLHLPYGFYDSYWDHRLQHHMSLMGVLWQSCYFLVLNFSFFTVLITKYPIVMCKENREVRRLITQISENTSLFTQRQAEKRTHLISINSMTIHSNYVAKEYCKIEKM